jgi:hypothetical protein
MKSWFKSKVLGMTILSLFTYSYFITPSASASSRTRVIAQMSCANFSDVLVLNPEYYGRSRSGLDIWICVETGSGRQMFLTMNSGPYAVIACNMIECKLIDWIY